MHAAVIAATGLFTPAERVTNAELVEAFNAFVEIHNARHADAIAAGEMEALAPSSVEFIEKASGIKSRYVMNRSGVVDPEVMHPLIPERSNDELSVMAEIGVAAAKDAIARWGKDASQIDAVVCAASNMQRAYPAMAIEIQQALGIEGFGFDMNVACSSATFGIKTAADYIATGSARAVLVVNPEITSGHLNFRDRDSHFIFGDVSTAVILERAETCTSENSYEILSTKALTKYSINIRSNFGHMSYANDVDPFGWDKLFHQSGRKVFEEVSPVAARHITDHLASLGLTPRDIRRFWIHQANINMNKMVMKQLLGEEPTEDVAPTILDRYANTASAGSIIAFNLYNRDLKKGDIGVICSFGAGYSVGSLVVRKR